MFNLKALGEVPKGQKINTRGDNLSPEKDSYLQWARRLADGRTKVFRDINRYVSTVVEISTRIMESKYFVQNCLYIVSDDNLQREVDHNAIRHRAERIKELYDIIEGLSEGRRGIIGQQDTYKDDVDVRAITVDIIKRIDDHTAIIKEFLRENGEKIDE